MNILSQKKLLILLCLVIFGMPVITIGCDSTPEVEDVIDNDKDKDKEDEDEDEDKDDDEIDYSQKSITVTNIDELRIVAQMSGKVITMKPGEYTVENTMPEDPKTIFDFSGSDNKFIFKDVKIFVPTSVLRNMGPGNVHEFATYRFNGSNITFEEGHFENTGDEKEEPFRGISEFEVQGNNISFIKCKIIIRGSFPYGYGEMYGKGSGSAVRMRKHSAMGIMGDNVLVEDCHFEVYSFGHGIHIHGSQNTIIRNIYMKGAIRLTDEIYEETTGPAAEFNYQVMFPDWLKGQPIPKGEMLSLTEDGIRAYLDGNDIDGNKRRTGHITVENCTVEKMRGGITLTLGSGGATVTGCTVIDCDHGYSLPSGGKILNSKGNAAFGPLLTLPYSHKHSTNVELELMHSEIDMGDHPMAEISGSNHKIKFTYNNSRTPKNMREIIIGTSGGRYNSENSTPEELQSKHGASGVIFNNQTPHPVRLTEYSSTSTVTSEGEVIDEGKKNSIK